MNILLRDRDVPLVSVIIPVYNGQSFIKECIISILNQSYSNIEIIVVDDGSTDDTNNIVMNLSCIDSRIKYVFQNNSGTSSIPKNNGFILSKGDFVNFFDADDIMLHDKIESQVNVLMHHSNLSAVCGDYINFIDSKDYERGHFASCVCLRKILDLRASCPICGVFQINAYDLIDIISKENFTINSSTLFRRNVFEKSLPFSSSLRGSEDWFLHFNIFLRSHVGIIDKIGFRRRLHEANKTNNIERVLLYRAITRDRASLLVADSNIKNDLNNISANYYLLLSKEIAKKDLKKSLMYLKTVKKHTNYTLYFFIRNFFNIIFKRLFYFLFKNDK